MALTEKDIIKARAAAELEVEPLLRIFKQTLIESYIKGFMKGMESKEDAGVAMKRLVAEAEALEGGATPTNEEPCVKLKPDAILKRRLKKEDFPSRVWQILKVLNIETLGDILQVSERFYLSQRNFGIGSLFVLRKYVRQFGYELKEK